jgi:hypothetical protein
MSIRTSTPPGPRAGRRLRYGIDGKTISSANGLMAVTPRPRRSEDERPRRLRTLLSFQRSVPVEAGNKKTSDSRQRPTDDSVRDVSDSFLGPLRCRVTGRFCCLPRGRPIDNSSIRRACVKQRRRCGRSAASRPARARLRPAPAAGRAPSRPCRRA